MGKIKFYPRVMLSILIIAVLISGIIILGNKSIEISGIYENVDEQQYILDMKGYLEENNIYSVHSDDPQIIFDFSDYGAGKLYGLTIVFEESISPDNLTIYYAGSDRIFSEYDSKSFAGAKRQEFSFIIPEEFSVVRLDVNESFGIKEFKVASEFKKNSVSVFRQCIGVLIGGVLIGIALSIYVPFASRINNTITTNKDKFIQAIKKIINNKKIILCNIAGIIFVLLIVYIAEKMLVIAGVDTYFKTTRYIVIVSALAIIYVTFIFKDKIMEKLHIYFFIVVLITGSANVFISAPVVGLAHDDEIHYERAAYMSWGCNGKISYTDKRVKDRYKEVIVSKDVYSSAVRQQWMAYINKVDILDEQGRVVVDANSASFNLQYVAYVPSSAAILLGRALDLSFTNIFMLGKLANILTYSLLFALAIKVLKNRGRLIVLLIGLIPTNIFLASSYSYDWWVISFIALGYALFISKLQSKEKISMPYLFAIVMIMIVGMLPKAIYFPLLLPMLLLPKDRYTNSKWARIIASIGIIILITTFVLPMIISGEGNTDIRGGSDVNSIEQMKFILKNSVEYVTILFSFMMEYLSLDNADGYITMLGYNGIAKYFVLCIVLITCAIIFDNNKYSEERLQLGIRKKHTISKIVMLISVFVSIVLVITALYVAFTPVAHGTVNGCQPRYLLPVILPMLLYLGELNIDISDKLKRNYASIASVLMLFVFLYGMYDVCGKLY